MRFKEFYANQAKKPSGLFGRFVMSRIFEKGNVFLNEFMKETLEIKENEHVLEIGFGTGKLISELAGKIDNGLIEGIDFSDAMAAIAIKRNKKYIDKGKVIIKQGDFEVSSYNENSFDKICSAHTLYFWSHPDVYVKKIFRMLRPGGKCILGIIDKEYMKRMHLSENVFRYYNEEDISRLLNENGFPNSVEIHKRERGGYKYYCAVALKS